MEKQKGKLLILFFIFVAFAFYLKPLFLFKSNGKLREYGVGKDSEGYTKTLFNFLTVSVFFVFVCKHF